MTTPTAEIHDSDQIDIAREGVLYVNLMEALKWHLTPRAVPYKTRDRVLEKTRSRFVKHEIACYFSRAASRA